jgi:nicotinamide-nucleotide amidase
MRNLVRMFQCKILAKPKPTILCGMLARERDSHYNWICFSQSAGEGRPRRPLGGNKQPVGIGRRYACVPSPPGDVFVKRLGRDFALLPRRDLTQLAERALATARRRNLTIVTAESCTAGKLSALLSEAPGAGEHLHGSFVTYTKANKVEALGVDAGLLKAKGAVCREVAVAMAEGALHRSPADVAVAITGVAGPDPDEDGNPVGLVCIAVGRDRCGPSHVDRKYGELGRENVQELAMADALAELIRCLEAD